MSDISIAAEDSHGGDARCFGGVQPELDWRLIRVASEHCVVASEDCRHSSVCPEARRCSGVLEHGVGPFQDHAVKAFCEAIVLRRMGYGEAELDSGLSAEAL